MSKRTQKKISKKTDPRVPSLILKLKETSREKDVPLWRDMAKRLEAPKKNYAQINLSKLNRYALENDVVIVPGKVLGSGFLGHSVTVAALNFSMSARAKITDAGGKCMTIEDLLAENPEGSGIRIMR